MRYEKKRSNEGVTMRGLREEDKETVRYIDELYRIREIDKNKYNIDYIYRMIKLCIY